MKHLRKTAVVILCLVLAVALSACGSGGTDSSGGGKTVENSGASQTAASTPAFDMYKKISIGMTKDQVNAALGTAPIAETGTMAVPGTFSYKDKDGRFGVTVIFENNILYSKTVIYDSAKVLAPMTPKPVTEEQTNSVQTGMTNEEVVKIMGGEGVECSATAMPTDIKKVGVIKRWGNQDGSFAQIVLTDEGKAGNIRFFKAR